MAAKKRAGSGAEREAARRARQAVAAPPLVESAPRLEMPSQPMPPGRERQPADEVAASRLRARVKSVAILRQRLEAEVLVRDRYVARLRTLGWSWERIASEAGVSRQALMKRVKKA